MAPGDITDRHDEVGGRRLHTRWIRRSDQGSPLVFLHEGLGSIELWRDFPLDLVRATGHPAFLYSRHGYGWSEPMKGPRTVDYLHREALDVLPALLAGHIDRPPILVGHSDGASISIIHAGSGHPVAGMVLLAPHVFAEPPGLDNIREVHAAFPGSEMREKMAKYHADPEATFRGWAEIWLDPGFRSWNIEEYLSAIDCPVLLIQCEDDLYGTPRQLDAIETQLRGPVKRLILPGDSHSAHLAHPEAVTSAAADFVGVIEAGLRNGPHEA